MNDGALAGVVPEGMRSFGWPPVQGIPAPLPRTMPNGVPWPRISIVTPTFNQGCYIEETIASVVRQGYPNLEHIVIDGGSTDLTVEVLRKYDGVLTYWVSEKDRGQSHAINKGMARATGEILTWLNSDDMLAPGALAAVAMAFARSGADMVSGICEIHHDGVLVARHITACENGPLPLDDILDIDGGWNAGQFFYQPEVMFTRDLWERAGGRVEEHLYYSMDYDLWVRCAEAGAKLHVISRPVALFRQHAEQKTHIAAHFKAELTRYRAAYLARTDHALSSARPLPHFGRSLRMLFLNDHGWKYGAGIAHDRIAQACAMAGHTIVAVALAGPDARSRLADDVVEEVIAAAPDIILVGNLHGAGIEPGIIGALANRWPTLVFLHDLWWVTGRCAYTAGCGKLTAGCDATCPTPEEYPSLAPRLIHDAWLDKRSVLNEPDHPVLLAMSSWTQNVAMAALSTTDRRRVEKVVLGLPTDQFCPKDKRTCREHFGLPLDKFLVLCTATNLRDPRKGVDRVRALIAQTTEPDIVFVTVGHESLDGVAAIDRVIMLPYQTKPEEVARLYAAVDLILAPSREETLGQIYIEGAACATASIAFATTGITDAVIDGVTGLSSREETVAELRRLLLKAYNDPEGLSDLRQWARIQAESEWSLEA